MRYRRLDENGDYSFGNGANDFWQDEPDAVAQAVLTRLHLYQGEWFLATADGTPWDTRILGKRTDSTRDPAIKARILGTKGMKEISLYSSNLDRDARAFTVNANLTTIYSASTIALNAVLGLPA
jgi:hypothetical protein